MRSSHRFLTQTLAFLWFALLIVNMASAQVGSKSEATSQMDVSTQTLNITNEQAKESIQWLATKASKHLPRTISGAKNWGDTKRVWAGVKMRIDGFKLRTNRRFRELEQGRWIKYDIAFPEIPPAIKITEVSQISDESTEQQSWVITSAIASPLEFTARVQRWNLGVKLFSMTVSGKARIRLNATLSVGFHANYGEIPPGLVIAPSGLCTICLTFGSLCKVCAPAGKHLDPFLVLSSQFCTIDHLSRLLEVTYTIN